jgi:hypothetical protein
MYIFILFLLILLSIFYFFFTTKEGFDKNLADILPIQISNDNSTINVPNTIKGNQNQNLTFKGGINVNNNAIHKGNTFIKPTSHWVNAQPNIDLAIGDDDTGLKWKSDGIISYWGNAQEIGTFGHDGFTVNNRRTMEFGKGEDKEWNAGKIGYKTFSNESLDIVGAGRNGEARKVRIYDNLNVGNNLRVNGSIKLGTANNYWTIQARDNGWLEFLYNGTSQENYGDNVGHLIMSPDGNMWLPRSTMKGWIADNMKVINDKSLASYVDVNRSISRFFR